MSMGDNVASASLQFGSKAVEVGGHLAIKTIDAAGSLDSKGESRSCKQSSKSS